MQAMRWIEAIASRAGRPGDAFRRVPRAPRVACADCPIMMSCGLEPQPGCLPRLEAIAGGRRGRIEPLDLCFPGGAG